MSTGELPTDGTLEIGVMGSARLREGDERWTQAYEMGQLLASAGLAVVTGGYGGLMAAVSRGASTAGGRVIGLPMRHWTGLQPNQWNVDVRWASDYGTRLNHLLRCDAVVVLAGGVGTLSEMATVWAASQTEERVQPIVLLGACWQPVVQTMREYLVLGDEDLQLLNFAATPAAALQIIQTGLQENTRRGSGPRG